MNRGGTRTALVYGITAGLSADKLLRGQLGWLSNNGWDVHLAVDPDACARLTAEREGVTLEPVPMQRAIDLRADIRSLCAWFRLIRRLHPAVTNVSTPKAGLLGGLAAAWAGVPRRVYVLRGLRLEGTKGALGALLWAMEAVSMASATDVVVVSRSLGQEARRRHLPARRLWLVGEGSSNGVRADLVQQAVARAEAAALRSELGLSPAEVVVGYVGRVTADKGVESLLQAMNGLDRRIRLLVVGSIDDGPLRPALDALGSRLVHVGWTDDVWAYYAAMDVLCLPTRREGYPNVVLEAAAASVPTITTRATGALDSVVDGTTGILVNVDDAAELAAAITRLAEDVESRAQMGAAARERAERCYKPEHIWRGVESIMRGAPNEDVQEL